MKKNNYIKPLFGVLAGLSMIIAGSNGLSRVHEATQVAAAARDLARGPRNASFEVLDSAQVSRQELVHEIAEIAYSIEDETIRAQLLNELNQITFEVDAAVDACKEGTGANLSIGVTRASAEQLQAHTAYAICATARVNEALPLLNQTLQENQQLQQQLALEAEVGWVDRDFFRTIPLGVTERQLREFIGTAPDDEHVDDPEFDLWLHWSGVGRSQINVFIEDDAVSGTNYWADEAPGTVSLAQFTDVQNRFEDGIGPDRLWRWVNPITIEDVHELIRFDALRERRIFDMGDEVLLLDYPGWGNRIVTLGFINGELVSVDAEVVDPDDQMLVRSR